MAGSKRNKLKKVLSPPAPVAQDDEELMNDLMAQLDSRDKTVQAESANVLNAMQLDRQANTAQQKQDPKGRYQARQVSAMSVVCSLL